jgi:hypothetical protein
MDTVGMFQKIIKLYPVVVILSTVFKSIPFSQATVETTSKD